MAPISFPWNKPDKGPAERFAGWEHVERARQLVASAEAAGTTTRKIADSNLAVAHMQLADAERRVARRRQRW